MSALNVIQFAVSFLVGSTLAHLMLTPESSAGQIMLTFLAAGIAGICIGFLFKLFETLDGDHIK